MTEALEVVVDALAAYRLTRLITADVITKDLRDAFVHGVYVRAGQEGRVMADHPEDGPEDLDWSQVAEDDEDPPKLATLVTCRWCTGFYVSVGVVVASRWAPRPWRVVSRAFALSAAAALVARLETD